MYFCDEPDYQNADTGLEDGHGWGPGMVGHFTDAQVANQANWSAVGQRDIADAYLSTIHITPAGSSTTTAVNQLLPLEDRWLEIPTAPAPVIPAARW